MSKVTRVDPLTKTLIQLAFENSVDEAADILEKTAMSAIMAEIQDYCTGLLDAKGRLLALPNRGLPLHVASCELQLKAVLDKFGDDFEPGDVIIQNDPYTAYGNHLPDWTFVKPLFVDNKLTFFAYAKGHQQDTKGSVPAGYAPGAYDIQSEGLLIPPTKVFKAGERQEVYNFILHNVRWPEIVEMDNASMMGCLQKVQLAVVDVCKKYGKATVLAAVDELIEEAEKAVREEIRQWPEGTYEGESVADRDGAGHEDVRVKVAVTIKGGDVVVDFTGSDKQVTFINSPIGCTTGMAYMSIIPRLNPEITNNHGKLKPIKIIAPKGTVVNPEYPATVGACAVYLGGTIIEAVLMAMGKAIPDKVDGPYGAAQYPNAVGFDPRTNKPYWLICDAGGGGGAFDGADGCHAVGCACTGGQMMSVPVEQFEIKYPWHLLHVKLADDSAGAGKYRGGLGVDWLGLHQGTDGKVMTGACGGEKWPLFGIKGGKSGILSKMYSIYQGKEIPRHTFSFFTVETGEILRAISPGGGGHGNPFERPVEKVQDDVKNSYVSVEKAREDYGVVIDPKTLEVDLAATNRLRGTAAKEKKPAGKRS